MDERTEKLRDLFIDATGAEAVNERQEESPGSLVDRDEEAIAARVADLIAAMRDRYGFTTGLDDAAYGRVARGYFDGKTDVELAETIDAEATTARDARLDLHLVAGDDRDAPFDYARLKRLIGEGRSVDECAEILGNDAETPGNDAETPGNDAETHGCDPETVEEYAAVARTDLTSTRANDRYRDGFRELLTDDEMGESHAADARDDGLRDATEDIESDVSL